MLHTLIIKGKREVKKIIISAIIEQVQQPGSVPPEDVPALMEILRSTAEEQLSLVTSGNDEKQLANIKLAKKVLEEEMQKNTLLTEYLLTSANQMMKRAPRRRASKSGAPTWSPNWSPP